MSKLYKKYLELKKSNPSTIYIFKSGIFYIFLDEDAKKISPILNLKLSNLNEDILKCGFPINSFQKYINMLRNTNFDFQLVENISNSLQINNSNDFNSNAKATTLPSRFEEKDFTNFLNKIANINLDTLSIREVYSLLDDISNEAKKFL